MDFLELTHNKLSVDKIMELITASNCGAVSLFVGTTRDNFEDKKVLNLEYEVYETMAEKCMKQICTEMRRKWPTIENIAIHHRLGQVPVKEASVIIGTSSPHRVDAMQATKWCIDKLKETVPIWKKEIYEGAESEWKENAECTWSKNKIINKKMKEIKQEVVSSNVSSHLVQITCSNEELNRRINTFMQRKRIRANIANIKDFCGPKTSSDSCARVDSKLTRDKNSKSHLKMETVYNNYGTYNMTKNPQSTYISNAVKQRLTDIENCLEISKPVSPDIYQRLKQIEDRILYLESVSPEYANFWDKNSNLFGYEISENVQEPTSKKQKFTAEDIDKYIFELQEQAPSKI